MQFMGAQMAVPLQYQVVTWASKLSCDIFRVAMMSTVQFRMIVGRHVANSVDTLVIVLQVPLV